MTHTGSILTTVALFVFGVTMLVAAPPLGIVLLVLATLSARRAIRLERMLLREHRQERQDRWTREMILAAKSLP